MTWFETQAAAARSRQLGLMASLSFRRFVLLQQKYDPDQPRDDQGRWVDTEPRDVDATGSITPIVNEARTGDLEIDSITQKLAEKLSDVIDRVGEGAGAAYGTQVHTEFAEAVRNSGIPNLTVEETWKDAGLIARYGVEGSIPTDVVLRSYDDAGPIRAIWDVKTGGSALSIGRVNDLRAKVGVGADVPVIELSVRRGVSIKAAFLAAPQEMW